MYPVTEEESGCVTYQGTNKIQPVWHKQNLASSYRKKGDISRPKISMKIYNVEFQIWSKSVYW